MRFFNLKSNFTNFIILPCFSYYFIFNLFITLIPQLFDPLLTIKLPLPTAPVHHHTVSIIVIPVVLLIIQSANRTLLINSFHIRRCLSVQGVFCTNVTKNAQKCLKIPKNPKNAPKLPEIICFDQKMTCVYNKPKFQENPPCKFRNVRDQVCIQADITSAPYI